MNLNQLKKSVGHHVQLQPVACRLGQDGKVLPPIDDDWIIEEVTGDTVRITNPATGHTASLGKDHVHHYTSNPTRSAGPIKYGFLTLTVQVFLRADGLSIKPTPRPGASLGPDGTTQDEQVQRARLLDKRFQMVVADYTRTGTPRTMIDTFSDLAENEKAELYERAIRWKKGRRPKQNPYR